MYLFVGEENIHAMDVFIDVKSPNLYFFIVNKMYNILTNMNGFQNHFPFNKILDLNLMDMENLYCENFSF